MKPKYKKCKCSRCKLFEEMHDREPIKCSKCQKFCTLKKCFFKIDVIYYYGVIQYDSTDCNILCLKCYEKKIGKKATFNSYGHIIEIES